MALPETPARGEAAGDLSDLTPVLTGEGSGRTRSAGAAVSTLLTELGETLYEWDLETDRLRWAANAGDVLGIEEQGRLASGRKFSALVDPDSLTDRHQAVLNGIGVDSGDGVAYDIVYALKSGHGRPRIWVQDYGLWFADEAGRPYLARGAMRLVRHRPAITNPSGSGLPRRGDFLKTLDNVLAVARHYRTAFAFTVITIGNLQRLGFTEGADALGRVEETMERRLRRTVRGGDPAGWLSDHELGLALRIGHEQETGPALTRIVDALGEEIATDRMRFRPDIAAGAVIIPEQAESLAASCDLARVAAARARKGGARRFAFYERER